MKKEISKEAEKQENNNMTGGGYCSFNCIHYCEEYMDRDGGIVGDFNSDGYVEYYCKRCFAVFAFSGDLGVMALADILCNSKP